ncbi:2-amino-4-hydroxy-6-hydroxymethyldihydropteridine diphosphokinase [Thalassovita aquimarina]|uniref:2-amino-4-hydroxy-6- hydroxymethyldihydropteridine diphosphokinase n=1 Tax=Thalassovita aquimarina TaxID=2785917 RepID=UPI003561933B
MGTTQDVLIALGANLPLDGDLPADTLRKAIRILRAGGLDVVEESRFFKTPCFPAGAGPDYINAAIRCRTDWRPEKILEFLHKVEMDFGRVRLSRWGGRTLDLDIIAIDNQISPDRDAVRQWMELPVAQQMQAAPKQLILPHPRIQDRAFVLVPLADVAPGWKHPLLGKTVTELCDELPAEARAAVVAV